MESCSICLEMALISEESCIKIYVVVSVAEEKRGWIYGNCTFIDAMLAD